MRAGNWLSLKQAQALLNAPDITTTKPPRDRAIIAVLPGCALRRSAVAALTDGRCSGGFAPEATVAARHANAGPVGVVTGRFARLRFPTVLPHAPLRVLGAAEGVAGGAARPSASSSGENRLKADC